MSVYWSAILFNLFLFSVAPFGLYWRLSWSEAEGLTVAVRFSFADMKKTAERLAYSSEKPKPQPKKKKPGNGSPAESVAESILYIARRRSTRVRLSARIHLNDACATALICGFLFAAGGVARIPVRAYPEYAGARAYIDVRGMIRVQVGHIIYAALLFFARTRRRRFAQWKENRSKAS